MEVVGERSGAHVWRLQRDQSWRDRVEPSQEKPGKLSWGHTRDLTGNGVPAGNGKRSVASRGETPLGPTQSVPGKIHKISMILLKTLFNLGWKRSLT